MLLEIRNQKDLRDMKTQSSNLTTKAEAGADSHTSALRILLTQLEKIEKSHPAQ
jgi:hypothetical protein